MNISKEYIQAIKLWIATEKFTLQQASEKLGYSDRSSLKRILNGKGGASPERIREKFAPHIKKYLKSENVSNISTTLEKNDQLLEIFNLLKNYNEEDIKLFSRFLNAFNDYKK